MGAVQEEKNMRRRGRLAVKGLHLGGGSRLTEKWDAFWDKGETSWGGSSLTERGEVGIKVQKTNEQN